jgi:LmbE family N-acetylglucosaminyl deacetylase
MKLKNKGAEIFIPDNREVAGAFQRTTHMAISAHQDDIELMAFDGVLKCFGQKDQWFSAVVVTNGAGSPRDGLYADYTDEDMQNVRKLEQKKAAFIGEYGSLALLDYSSSAAKDPKNQDIIAELRELILASKPKFIYTHNLADKHDTHVGVVTKVIKALRELPADALPEKVYGCEVWRNLDWMTDEEKVVFDVSGHPNIGAALVEIFDSQICGGKRYDLAAAGRRISNATYAASHNTDKASALIYGMDLTPLIRNPKLSINEFVQEHITKFSQDVTSRIKRVWQD